MLRKDSNYRTDVCIGCSEIPLMVRRTDRLAGPRIVKMQCKKPKQILYIAELMLILMEMFASALPLDNGVAAQYSARNKKMLDVNKRFLYLLFGGILNCHIQYIIHE